MTTEGDSVATFVDGDQPAARLLRGNLQRLRDLLGSDASPVGDPTVAAALRSDIEAVLTGRTSMRELAADPAFTDLANVGMRRAHDAWRALSPEDRATQVRGGRATDGVTRRPG